MTHCRRLRRPDGTDRHRMDRLTQADVARLLADPSPRTRAKTTAKIAEQFNGQGLSAAERRIAEDIFRALVHDAEVMVRAALAAHLKATPHLPRDIAVALARDVDSVALPLLRFSDALSDEDLIGIVRSEAFAKQIAIAERREVSPLVSDALVDSGNAEAVARLVGNEGAQISEATFDRVLAHYEEVPAVAESLARRGDLPPAIAEHIVAVISERLQRYLVSKHELPGDLASNLILQARERATVALLDYGSSDLQLDELVDQLHRKQRLTPSLLLRALCVGDLNFFERAVARLAGLPLQNVRILIHDKGMLGLEPLYRRAALPGPLFPAFRAAIGLVVETDYDGGANDRQRYVERILERMLTNFEDPTERIAADDIEYLMAKLQRHAA